MRPELRNVSNQGFIGIIMMMGVSTLALMGLLSSSYQKKQLQLNSGYKVAVDMLQQNYSLYIQDETAWKNTFEDPNNDYAFKCLKDPSVTCTTTSVRIPEIRNAKNEVVVDTADYKGVRADGTLCVETNINAKECDFHVDVKWRPICRSVGPNCTAPPTLIEVNISIAKSSAQNNAARFIASNAAGIMRRPQVMPVATAVGVGFEHTCALAGGDVYCWGSSFQDTLGPVSNGGIFKTPQKVTGIPTGVTKLDVGYRINCAISGGNVYCWGGYFPKIPEKIYTDAGVPLANVVDVTAGVGHACAITSDGAAYCWGGNGRAYLGYKSPPTPDFPPDYMTDTFSNTTAFPVYGLSRGANGPDWGETISISAGLQHSCAVLKGNIGPTAINGGVLCWGVNEQRGGNGDMSAEPYYLLAYKPRNPYINGPMTAKGYKICYPGVTEGTPLPGPPGDPMFMYGLFLPLGPGPSPSDTLFCNPKPELTDYPVLNNNVKQVVTAGEATCALYNDGHLNCWTYYNYGRSAQDPAVLPLTDANYPMDVTTITNVDWLGRHAAGFFALKAGKLFAWGRNPGGNPLGEPSGALGSLWMPFELTGLPPNVTNAQGGALDQGNHFCAVAGGKVYCWGANNLGQLGDGTLIDRTMGNPIMVTTWP